MQLTIFDAMIYPNRPPVIVNKDKVVLTNRVRHSISTTDIRAFISGQVERLTAIYGEVQKNEKLNTKKYSPFHGE